jgi:hypothetical protein
MDALNMDVLIINAMCNTLGLTWFRRGLQSMQGIPRVSGFLVNPSGKSIVANDETYSLAA